MLYCLFLQCSTPSSLVNFGKSTQPHFALPLQPSFCCISLALIRASTCRLLEQASFFTPMVITAMLNCALQQMAIVKDVIWMNLIGAGGPILCVCFCVCIAVQCVEADAATNTQWPQRSLIVCLHNKSNVSGGDYLYKDCVKQMNHQFAQLDSFSCCVCVCVIVPEDCICVYIYLCFPVIP